MKRIITLLMALCLSVSCIFALSACKKNKETATEVKTEVVYEIKKDDDKKEYAVVKKYSISEADAKKIASGDYELQTLTINEYDDGEKTLPVKEIESGAFSNQVIFNKIVIGSNVEKIGLGCFAGCVNLEELTLPFVGESVDAVNSAKTLGCLFGSTEIDGASAATVYHNSSASTTYYIPDSLKKVTVTGDVLSEYAFNGTAVKEVILSGAIDKIGEGAFANMTAIGKITVPATVKTIGKRAFSKSAQLYKVDFAEGSKLETIYSEAFLDCAKLGFGSNDVKIPSSVKKIYYATFKNCKSLTKIDLSATGITELPGACFNGCEKLKNSEIKLPSSITLAPDSMPE